MNAPDSTPVVEIIHSYRFIRLERRRIFKKRFGYALLALLVISLITYSALSLHKQTTQKVVVKITPTPTTSPTLTPTPTPIPKVASALDGEMVDPGLENLHPLAVMIENHPDARPQSGLSQAALVYEAIAEGGITRFLAIYNNPTLAIRVGPIRSARTYFVDFADEIKAFYAHVGGNIDALDKIAAGSTLDLNQFNIGAPVFQRDMSRGVALEHTMYSSTDKLWNYATTQNKWSSSGDYTPWTFQDDPPTDKRSGTQNVSVSVSDSLYSVKWVYDPTTNTYSRFLDGAPHIDANNNQQIKVSDIVLQTVNRAPTVTRINEQGWNYTLTGSGPAVIIQNGKTIQATWKKTGDNRTRFYDQNNQEIPFTRGHIWIEITHSDSIISYN